MTGFARFTNRDIASLVKKVTMLCPIAYLDHVTSPLSRTATTINLDQVLFCNYLLTTFLYFNSYVYLISLMLTILADKYTWLYASTNTIHQHKLQNHLLNINATL